MKRYLLNRGIILLDYQFSQQIYPLSLSSDRDERGYSEVDVKDKTPRAAETRPMLPVGISSLNCVYILFCCQWQLMSTHSCYSERVRWIHFVITHNSVQSLLNSCQHCRVELNVLVSLQWCMVVCVQQPNTHQLPHS